MKSRAGRCPSPREIADGVWDVVEEIDVRRDVLEGALRGAFHAMRAWGRREAWEKGRQLGRREVLSELRNHRAEEALADHASRKKPPLKLV